MLLAGAVRSVLENVTFHTLRHTFASWLMRRGRTLLEVKDALGHQTVAMTVRYAHLAPDHLRAAVAALDGVLTTAPITQEITQEPSQTEVVLSA